ncbi:CatB-related O-acetyltransferase [Rhizobium sp. BG4]|uniref:CatB-related O-acetyltransferase n=1 Tax=Rhizobium sp. BG4 TaxID=2613770 RepID=UPI001AFC5EA3|nr:CatB-related O-acetyltransferase [Rhizobium sp. BG4]QRM43190.1 antibiotic acetyltransferase [Rhizobium sp. BG4]
MDDDVDPKFTASATSTIPKSVNITSQTTIEHPIHVGPGCVVMADSIGRYCFINANTCIFDSVTIGKFVTFARNCQIGGVEHPIHYVSTSFFRISKKWFPDDPVVQGAETIPNKTPKNRKRSNKIVVGSDVWFGASSLVLKGITIGDGAVVGAGAVVTKDVPPYAIVAGNPAKIIRYRFDHQTIRDLLRLRWWDRDIDIILKLPLDNVEKTIALLSEIDAEKTKPTSIFSVKRWLS